VLLPDLGTLFQQTDSANVAPSLSREEEAS
jgi:hypothetical protein